MELRNYVKLMKSFGWYSQDELRELVKIKEKELKEEKEKERERIIRTKERERIAQVEERRTQDEERIAQIEERRTQDTREAQDYRQYKLELARIQTRNNNIDSEERIINKQIVKLPNFMENELKEKIEIIKPLDKIVEKEKNKKTNIEEIVEEKEYPVRKDVEVKDRIKEDIIINIQKEKNDCAVALKIGGIKCKEVTKNN